MLPSYEAEIDQNGHVRLLEPLPVTGPCRALVTVMASEKSEGQAWLTVAESALAEDWNKPEEDEAWAHLHPDK